MENISLYDKVRTVPKEALKTITGGKLNGMTDINPMWRIKALTEQFGMCGVGWKTEIDKQWIEVGKDGRTAAFCNLNLSIKIDGEWSAPIPGNGGSMLEDLEKGAPRTSDECFKMAYTDALSVCCKMLGFGADVYFAKDVTKYDQPYNSPAPAPAKPAPAKNTAPVPDAVYTCTVCNETILPFLDSTGQTTSPKTIASRTNKRYGAIMCLECAKKAIPIDPKH